MVVIVIAFLLIGWFFATSFYVMLLIGAIILPVTVFGVALLLIYIRELIMEKLRPPIAGLIFSQLIHFNTLFDYHTSLARKYPTYRLIMPSRTNVYTVDPANVEHILKTNFSNYGKGQYHYGIMKDLFGDGIFTVDGDKWRHQRKIASYEFSTKILRDFSTAVFRANAAKLVAKVSETAALNKMIDFQDTLRKSTFDSIFKVGFGVVLNSLSGSDEFGNQFTKAFDDSNFIVYWRYVDLFWKIKKCLNIGLEASLKRNIKVMDDFIFELIRCKREKMKTEKNDEGKEDILSRFLIESEKDPENMTDQYLRDIILNFILAGRDSIANTLTWFFYVLCKHPFLQEKIAQEVKQATKADGNISIEEFTERITEEAMDKMQYLHAALTETLRLYPAIPVDGKNSYEDDILPDGFKIKKGDGVNYMAYAMGRMTYIWGDDAEEFRPERWLENGVFRPESLFKFTAFQYHRSLPLPAITMELMGFLCNPISLAMAVLALAVFFAIFTLKRSPEKKKKKKYHPIAGTVFHQLLNFKRLHHYMTDLAFTYKTYRLLSPSRSEVYTADPANVEYILKTNFPNYGKGWHNYSILKDLLGDGIFTVDGDKWRHQRKVSSYEFSTRVLRDFSSVVFQSNVAKLARIVSEAATSSQIMDIQDLFMKSTLDSIFKVAFGVELDSMCGSSEEGACFANAFDDSSAMTLWRYVDTFWKIKRFFNIGPEAALRKNIKVIDAFVYKLIHSKTKQVRNPQHDLTMKKEDILSRFLEVNETDPKYLRDIILNFIIAGKDTTATTLSWFLYMLCKHPLIQEKVAQEVKEATKVKDNTPFGELAASMTEEVLDNMQYLHAALTETLRLYPAVPVDAKICFSDDTLPDGFSVRKGDMVSYQPYAMGRMRFIWGDDAEDFRPERWLNEDGVFQQESPFKFTAFQAGPRICLGKEFAYRQMKIFSAVLLSCFRFKLSDENKAVNYRTMINLHIDGGLHLRAFHRSGNENPKDAQYLS
ncbi:hypothetical protein HHK36_027878 [Tetracentron sinense]|uniref:Cytochrome P450 n=1 Tax=Tetracentron sinense TaxID=13715 RepID=A0A834YDW5_TETSI|nr:hypothetical protein HHK36_027878 [Tetracentron sinense]